MAEMLLINPRRRKARRAAPAKRRASVKRRRNPIASALAAMPARRRSVKRRRNPIKTLRRAMRRRRNPIGGSSVYMSMLKDAVVGGLGSIGVDYLMNQVNPMLPESLRPSTGNITANDALRAALTVFAGTTLAKHTKGYSLTAARGALTVQVAAILNTIMPAPASALGYYSPSRVVQGTNRVGPIRQGMNAYMPPNRTPLLNGISAYTQPGRSPLLSSSGRSSAQREGVTNFK